MSLFFRKRADRTVNLRISGFKKKKEEKCRRKYVTVTARLQTGCWFCSIRDLVVFFKLVNNKARYRLNCFTYG